ncbi:MAG: aminopeptidase P family protein [Candidatus Omnitrophota bacterium]|jgi:Xaa-Pro aminopeptidase
MKKNILIVYDKLKTAELDALIISSPQNISFLTGYQSRDSFLLLSGKEKTYLTDSRYTAEAKKHLRGYTVRETKGGLAATLLELSRIFKLKRIGFEEKYTNYAAYKYLKKIFKHTVTLTGVPSWVEELRQVKTPEELKEIKKAVQITIAAFTYIKKFIKAGKKELEIAGELERFIRYNGASGASFDIIVAAGANSSFPHHLTSARVIKRDEPVLIDMGIERNGFKSDLTRVFFSGKINSLENKVYGIVREAQERAIRKIKPGIPVSEIDAAARQYIAERGYGKNFLHSLGHGIGREVHEAPAISEKNKAILKPGMVLTIEPGIYLARAFGIRIEDMVAVTKNGMKVLSKKLPK